MSKNSKVNIIHITAALDNLTETFIQGFIKEIDLLDEVELNVFTLQKPKLLTSLRNPVEYIRCSIFTKLKIKLRERLNLFTALKQRLVEYGISKEVYDKSQFIFVDFSVNFLNLFKGVDKFEKPIFVFLHGYDASKVFRNSEFKEKFQLYGSKKNVFFVSPCEYFLNKLKINFGIGQRSLINLPYGVNLSSELQAAEIEDSNIYKLLFVGRFVPKKNPLALIEVLNYLVNLRGFKNIQLVMIGEGPLLYEVIDRIKRYNLDEYAVLQGALPHKAVLNEYNKARIYVQHSVTDFEGDQEGLPNSILEALSNGIPIVSTIHSGIPEIIKEGHNGFLVPEFDYKGMGEKILLLLTNSVLYSEMRNNIVLTRGSVLWTNRQRVEHLLKIIRANCLNS